MRTGCERGLANVGTDRLFWSKQAVYGIELGITIQGSKHRWLQTHPMIVAAFDFDGTLTRNDTMFPFLRHVAGRWKYVANIVAATPGLCSYALGRTENQVAKEQLFGHFLKGLRKQDIEQMGKEFALSGIPRMLRVDAVEKLRWHRNEGHYCVLLSASLDVYVSHWAHQMGFDDIACSRLQFDSQGIATGYLDGKNCYGPEKVRRLEQLLDRNTVSVLYAYGDSRGDKELLALADQPFYRHFSG